MSNQSDASGPSETVRRYVDAFNLGDEDGLAACFVENGSILDGMAPYVYAGPSATREWYKHAKALTAVGIADFHMSLGTPSHDATVENAAYFVAPASLSFKAKGQPVTQSGAIFTVALQRIEGRWLIASWAWAKGAGGGTDDAKGEQ